MTNVSEKKLAVVIPVYNEQECIREVLSGWNNVFTFHKIDFDFIVIQDGSTDDTPLILEEMASEWPHLKVTHQSNSGHGSSVIEGYRRAVKGNYQWIFQVDSDNQFHPEDFMRLWAEKEGANFHIGWRENRQDAQHRFFISQMMKRMIFQYFGVEITDPNSPFRLIKRDFLGQLMASIPLRPFAPNIFLAILAKKANQLQELPVRHKSRQTGTNSLVSWGLIKACFRSWRELISFKLTIDERLEKMVEFEQTDHFIKSA